MTDEGDAAADARAPKRSTRAAGRSTARRPHHEPPQLYPLVEVARLLGVSTKTVARLIREGDLPSVTIGARVLVRADHLAAWVEQHTHYGDDGRHR